MIKKFKNIQWAVSVGLIFSFYAVYSTYLSNLNYVNTAKYHPIIQWLFLWLITSIVIFLIESILINVKKINK